MESQKVCAVGLLLLVLVGGLWSCRSREDYSHMRGQLGLIRMDSVLMRGGGGQAVAQVDSGFATLWARMFGYEAQEGIAEFLDTFASDSSMQALQDTIFRVFPTTDRQARALCEGFGRLHELVPEVEIPRVYFCNGGFHTGYMMQPGVLGIALDHFLGRRSPYYELLAIPRYQREGMEPARVATDAIKGWLEGMYPLAPGRRTVLDHMVYYGKLLYISQQVLPDEPDSVNLTFGSAALTWLERHEAAMWAHLSEQNVLFDTQPLVVSQLTQPAPYTRAFGTDSPGRAAVWLGYRIVCAYMKANRGVTLQALYNNQDARSLLSAASYAPR